MYTILNSPYLGVATTYGCNYATDTKISLLLSKQGLSSCYFWSMQAGFIVLSQEVTRGKKTHQ